MYSLPEEAIAILVLSADVEALSLLSKTNTFLNKFLQNPYILQQLGFVHQTPAPQSLEELQKLTKMDLNKRLKYAAEKGDKEGVLRMLEVGATDYDSAMISAASADHKDIVQWMSDRLPPGNTSRNETMAYAAREGHRDIIEWMLSLGATNYNFALVMAAMNGRKDIMELMISLGATDYDLAMSYAATGDHKDIVQLMLDMGATNYDETMAYAKERGHTDIVKLIEKWKKHANIDITIVISLK